MYNSFREAAMNALNNIKKFNDTPTMDLIEKVDHNLANEVISIIRKYQNKLRYTSLEPNEAKTITKYITVLNEVINHDCEMCKVIPNCDIKDILNLKRDISGFFARKADVFSLLNNSTDYFDILYNSLRLDYSDSPFNKKEDRYMGLLKIRLPKFSLRTPLHSDLAPNSDCKIEVEINLPEGIRRIFYGLPEPYSGIGITANQHGVPEFYISICNNETTSRFPQVAFSSQLYIIGHSNRICALASFDSGDNECAADKKFLIYENYKELAKINNWID